MNIKPTIPTDKTCPTPDQELTGYYTSEQSVLNTARKDKFRLIIDIPKILRPLLEKENRACRAGNMDRLQYSIYGNILPEISVPAIENIYGGQSMQFTSYSRPAYQPIQVSFIVDNRFDNYYVIWKWLQLMNDPEKSGFDANKISNANGFIKDYSSTFTLQALDEYEQPVAEFIYTDSFPIGLGNINYNYRDANEIDCSFTFVFSKLLLNMI